MDTLVDRHAYTTKDMMEKDPTIIINKAHDEANGETPDPPMRYGEPLPSSWIPLYKKPMRTPTRKLRIVCMGGGIAAMNLAYTLYYEWEAMLRDCTELVIYEANEHLGGTWLVNTYPGVACDVPAHIYTFPFEPNPDWSSFYVPGPEILQYFHATVTKYRLDRGVKCGHRVTHAQWDEEGGKWSLKMETNGRVIEDTADIFISAVGFLSRWRWPSLPNLHDFKGTLIHSAAWDASFDPENKRLAVIGNGSSAIQIIPQMIETAAHLTNFIRHPTYITAGLGASVIGGQTQYFYSEEEKHYFRENPEEHKAYRKKIQHGSNRAFDLFVKNSEAQKKARQLTVDQMKARLGNDEELAKKLTPTYEVGCRRSTPGPGYLEAFKRDNVSLVTVPIQSVSSDGIVTVDGVHHQCDAIICATGFDVSHKPPFPLIGRDGITLSEYWDKEPTSYLSLCVSHFPNFFTFAGPNAPVGHGSLMASMGWSSRYVCQWLKKIAEEDIKHVEVKQEVLDEFNTYGDEIMQTLAWSGGCQSWYKNHRTDGRVTAVWAGSALSYHDMIESLRPEDFAITYRSKNRFRFMGNGRSAREYNPDADLAWYLR